MLEISQIWYLVKSRKKQHKWKWRQRSDEGFIFVKCVYVCVCVEVNEIKCRDSNISGVTKDILTKLIGTLYEKHNLKIVFGKNKLI